MKKILVNIILLVTFCIPTINANAKVFTPQDVVDFYRENTNYAIDAENLVANENILEYYINGVKDAEADFSNGYLEVLSSSRVSYTNLVHIIYDAILGKLGYYVYTPNYIFTHYCEHAFELPKTLEEWETFYETYGIIDYVEEGHDSYWKFTLDTDKHDYSMEKIFAISDEHTNDQQKARLLQKPEITIEETDEKTVMIYPQADVEAVGEDFNYCYVYRSTKQDSGYTRINDDKIKCNGEYGVTDDTLEPNMTYYYKARLVYTNQYSTPIEVTTLKEDTTTTTTQKNNTDGKTTTTQVPDNPSTGVSSHIFAIILLIPLLGIVAMLILRKNKVFRRF